MKASYRRMDTKGQGLLEFALVLPLLVIIMFGLLDLGRAFFTIIVISNASREGARYLTQNPDDNIPDPYGNTFYGTKQAAIAEAQGSIVNLTPSDVNISYCLDNDTFEGCDSGYPVEVRVTYQFKLILGSFLPSPVNLTRFTRMMVP